MKTNTHKEEEKKVMAALLGKLYVSPTSAEDKIRETYAQMSEAVENQLVSDTTGRNALYKIHVALGKIVNNLDQQQQQMEGYGRRSMSRSTSVGLEDRTVVPEDKTITMDTEIKEEEEEGSDEGTVVHRAETESFTEGETEL